MTQEEFGLVHKKYGDIYRGILRHIYPAKNSTGFPERNLSVNFSKAYESSYPSDGCFTWYELQFGEKNNLHYDACIIDVENKRMLLIESKRFSNPGQKVREVISDVQRIEGVSGLIDGELKTRIPHISQYDIYGVILADAWDETKEKRKIIDSFQDGSFFCTYIAPAQEVPSPDQISYYVETDFPQTSGKYYLLTALWKVKSGEAANHA